MARSCRMQWLPMKPDPPVTRIVLIAALDSGCSQKFRGFGAVEGSHGFARILTDQESKKPLVKRPIQPELGWGILGSLAIQPSGLLLLCPLLLLGFLNEFAELGHGRDVRRLQRVLGDVAPGGGVVQGIFDSAAVDFEHVVGGSNLRAGMRRVDGGPVGEWRWRPMLRPYAYALIRWVQDHGTTVGSTNGWAYRFSGAPSD